MEKQIIVDFKDIVGVRYTCPECSRGWCLSRADLGRYYVGTDGYSFCPVCAADKKKAGKLHNEFEGEFRYLAGIVCGLTDFTKVKLRLIVGDMPLEEVRN